MRWIDLQALILYFKVCSSKMEELSQKVMTLKHDNSWKLQVKWFSSRVVHMSFMLTFWTHKNFLHKWHSVFWESSLESTTLLQIQFPQFYIGMAQENHSDLLLYLQDREVHSLNISTVHSLGSSGKMKFCLRLRH